MLFNFSKMVIKWGTKAYTDMHGVNEVELGFERQWHFHDRGAICGSPMKLSSRRNLPGQARINLWSSLSQEMMATCLCDFKRTEVPSLHHCY